MIGVIADLFLKARVPLALFLLGFAAGWQVNEWRWEARRAGDLQAALDARIAAERSAAAHAQALEARLAAIHQSNRHLTPRIAHETRLPEYRCRIPDRGLQLLNAARTRAEAPGQPDGTLPGP